MTEERHRKKARGSRGELRLSPKSSNPFLDDGDKEASGDMGTFPSTDPTPPQSLQEIGILELVEADHRPTFVIDIQPTEAPVPGGMNVVFCNTSLRFFDDLRRALSADAFYPSPSPSTSSSSASVIQDANQAEADFKEWATSLTNLDRDGLLPRHAWRGMSWSCATLRDRWRVISASQVPNQRRQSRFSSRSTSRERAVEQLDPEEADLTKQLADSMSKFRVLTELSPVGMYYLTPGGDIAYANEMWYEITGHPKGLEGDMSFMNVIAEIDHPVITKEWNTLVTEKGKRIFELRLRNPWVDPSDPEKKPRQRWIIASCDQEFEEDGTLKSVMGCITDISLQKKANDDAVERANLVETLALRTQEAAQHEKSFGQMAELAPCGMFTFDPEGRITWANSQWYEMTGHSRDPAEHCTMSFLNFIEQQDHDEFRTQWEKLTVAKEEVNAELRLKKAWIRQEGTGAVQDTTWILFLALPQLDEYGKLSSVLGCTTDISHFKWAESVQLQSRLQAEEAKRQQENFIDMTSHEMRNPLSAMLMCADGIADSLIDFQSLKDKTAVISQELVENNLDAAQTIVLCAQHQKRIIDDVLTLSKLNSMMLHVTPVQVDIKATIHRTLKMFENELQTHNIGMKFKVESSYNDSKIDTVFCDPVRLTQIFINLLTNAIKFTRSEDKRHIDVRIGASASKPPKDAGPDIQWFPSKDANDLQDLTLAPEWGTGEQVYLYFAVGDTGRGLDEDEKTRLFHRFSQASPRTHVQYGGSGLGLFISRELTELQGGEIGVASVAGEGSTFAFYIKGRKSTSQSEHPPLNSRMFPDNTLLTTPLASPAYGSQPTTPIRIRYNYHILLVEDNLINQKVLSKQLRGGGCTVHVANHGGEALEFIAKTNLWNHMGKDSPRMELSLILMDLEMPVMDGLTCCRRIRDLQREGKIKCHVPIIAVTANTRMEQMDLAIEAGMDDIVPKPFQIPELMHKTDQLMSRQSYF